MIITLTGHSGESYDFLVTTEKGFRQREYPPHTSVKRYELMPHIRGQADQLLYTPLFSGREKMFDAAGFDLSKIDFAVPQSWFDLFQDLEYSSTRAVWSYENESILGIPIYDLEAQMRIKALLTLRIGANEWLAEINRVREGEEDAEKSTARS